MKNPQKRLRSKLVSAGCKKRVLYIPGISLFYFIFIEAKAATRLAVLDHLCHVAARGPLRHEEY